MLHFLDVPRGMVFVGTAKLPVQGSNDCNCIEAAPWARMLEVKGGVDAPKR